MFLRFSCASTARVITPLSRSDLIFSMLKLNWRESAEGLPEFVRQINEGNDFGIDTDFVIRCLFAVSEMGTKFELDSLRKKQNVQRLRNNFKGKRPNLNHQDLEQRGNRPVTTVYPR